MATRFIDDRIMRDTDGGVRLVGGRCRDCSLVSFPRAEGCARCGGDEIGEHLLSDVGTIWTWTTQGFLPKRPYTGPGTPQDFTPYVLGYVELDDGIRIEARIDAAPDEVVIGQEVRLVAAPHAKDADGAEVLMFAFRPTGPGPEVAA